MHAGQAGPGVRIDLRRTAGDDDPRVRTFTMRASDGLTRLPLRLGGYRAGIDDDRVGQSRGMAAHDLGLIRIQPAAEGKDIDRHDAYAARSISPVNETSTGPVIST